MESWHRAVRDSGGFPWGEAATGSSRGLQKYIGWMTETKGSQAEGAPWPRAINETVGFHISTLALGLLETGATARDETGRWRVV